jgi:aminoglycoside phosphotransferase (APT) family kinase protein
MSGGRTAGGHRSVSAELAGSLIREQFPELEAARVEAVGEGWDHVVYRVDRAWAFRFPRRPIGAETLSVECAVLPLIADRLPLPVPFPRWIGVATEAFPWPFVGSPWLPGTTATLAAPDPGQRGAMAAPLGRFLATLHALPTDAPQLPEDRHGRLDPGVRREPTRERLAELAERRLIEAAEPWLHLLELPAIGQRPARVVHGDLHGDQLLVQDRRVTGILDWGDLHRGDPACDLMLVFTFLPPEARHAFLSGYGPIDAAAERLARFRGLHHAVLLAIHADATSNADLARESRLALEHLIDRR